MSSARSRPPPARVPEPFFDGYSLGSWRDRAAFDETIASPGWQALAADGPNVFRHDVA